MRSRTTASLAAAALAVASLTAVAISVSATVSPAAAVTTYTTTEVAGHNNATSCWTIVNGNVYDLTAWIDLHPGGPSSSWLCVAKTARLLSMATPLVRRPRQIPRWPVT